MSLATLGRQARGAGRWAADLIWPPRSLLSDARVDRPGTMEWDLWRALDFLAGPVCTRCGVPMEDAPTPDVVCGACLAAPPVWDRARGALAYDDLSRPLVLDLKHAGRRDGLPVFAGWLEAAAPRPWRAGMIVPVPSHWTRLFERGFNQAAWLAQALSRRTGVAWSPDLLVRARATGTQGGKSASGRARNVAGAFRVPAGARARLAGQCVLLVDDVHTTGATLGACARALRRGGAAAVDVVTLTRVTRPGRLDDAGPGVPQA